MHLAPVQVAVDGVPGDALLEQVERLDRHVEHAPGILVPHLRDELVLPRREPEDRLSAAASGRAPRDALALEQHDLVAALGQVQGR